VTVAPMHDEQEISDTASLRRAEIRALRPYPDAFELATGTTHRVLRSRAAMRALGAVA
jgi:hypothetical protein